MDTLELVRTNLRYITFDRRCRQLIHLSLFPFTGLRTRRLLGLVGWYQGKEPNLLRISTGKLGA
jgi:hypothetical protein